MKKIIFLAGIDGVGKSTIGERLAQKLEIPHHNASDLINNSYSKKNISNNQNILFNEIEKLDANTILLSGHFCILDRKTNKITEVPESVYQKLPIIKIILLKSPPETIYKHIKNREEENLAKDKLYVYSISEEKYAEKISKKCKIPMYIHHMKYDNNDAKTLENIIRNI